VKERSTPSARYIWTRRFFNRAHLRRWVWKMGQGNAASKKTVASPLAHRQFFLAFAHTHSAVSRRLVPGQKGLPVFFCECKKSLHEVLSLRNRRCDFSVLRSSRSRNGRSPSTEEPTPERIDGISILTNHPGPIGELTVHWIAGVRVFLVSG